MTDTERLYLFKLSQLKGFTPDWLDAEACNGNCFHCPAEAACRSFWMTDEERTDNHHIWLERFNAFLKRIDVNLPIEDIEAANPEFLI